MSCKFYVEREISENSASVQEPRGYLVASWSCLPLFFYLLPFHLNSRDKQLGLVNLSEPHETLVLVLKSKCG